MVKSTSLNHAVLYSETGQKGKGNQDGSPRAFTRGIDIARFYYILDVQAKRPLTVAVPNLRRPEAALLV